MQANLKISLVCATLMETELINQLVYSLINQKYKNWELIIVDQSKTFISNKFTSLDNRIKAIHSSTRGLSINRNTGLQIATGEILGFPDDDCYYDKNLLDEVVLESQNYSINSIIIVNRILYSTEDNLIIRSKENKLLKNIDIFKKSISYNLFFSNINKKNIEQLNFDINFGIGAYYGACEETKLVFSLLDKQWNIIRLNSCFVYHPQKSNTLDKNHERMMNYSRGFGALACYFFSQKKISILLLLIAGAMKNLVLGYLFGVKINKIKFNGFKEGFIKYSNDRK